MPPLTLFISSCPYCILKILIFIVYHTCHKLLWTTVLWTSIDAMLADLWFPTALPIFYVGINPCLTFLQSSGDSGAGMQKVGFRVVGQKVLDDPSCGFLIMKCQTVSCRFRPLSAETQKDKS